MQKMSASMRTDCDNGAAEDGMNEGFSSGLDSADEEGQYHTADWLCCSRLPGMCNNPEHKPALKYIGLPSRQALCHAGCLQTAHSCTHKPAAECSSQYIAADCGDHTADVEDEPGDAYALAPRRELPEGWRSALGAAKAIKAAEAQLRQGASMQDLHNFLQDLADCLELDLDTCEVSMNLTCCAYRSLVCCT